MRHERFGRASIILIVNLFGYSATAKFSIAQQKTVKIDEGYLTTADHVRLAYRKVGQGERFILFLHGGPGLSMDNLGYLMDALAGNGHTVIMYDQRGGGRSEVVKDPALLTSDSHVRDLEAVRRHFHIPRMSVIGVSWGSGLAAMYAGVHPERVTRLVFLTPMPPAKRPYFQQRDDKIASLIDPKDAQRLERLEKMSETAADPRIQAICREQFSVIVGPYIWRASNFDRSRLEATTVGREIEGICGVPPAALRNRPVVGRALLNSLGDFDFRPMLAKLTVPVLVIEGEKTNVPLDATREWARAAPGARLLLVPDAGHMVVEEKPETIHQIDEFLGGKWPAAAKEIGSVNSRFRSRRLPPSVPIPCRCRSTVSGSRVLVGSSSLFSRWRVRQFSNG